ncbi:hypothetical protein E2562_024052 [Oryza meyeriana var. granulata]|uniref:Uncharacterized protein n=1 Tax=Oryza meyeriana var. granulata TaxID=110450 RepID=A0A6G1CSL9_9ORYZ|nr:hypothetical protein E2562_024052 [Oryza meyeriana var. granulata]
MVPWVNAAMTGSSPRKDGSGSGSGRVQHPWTRPGNPPKNPHPHPTPIQCSVQLAGRGGRLAELPATHHLSGGGPAVQERESRLHHASRPPSAEVAHWRLEQASRQTRGGAGLLACCVALRRRATARGSGERRASG